MFPEKLYFNIRSFWHVNLRFVRSFWHFNLRFVLPRLFHITEKKLQTENPQLFDGIIDVTLFDGVGLNY